MDALKTKIKNAQCAANIEFNGNSCYSVEVLEEMINQLSKDPNHRDVNVKFVVNGKSKSDKIANIMDIPNVKRMKQENIIDYKKFLVDMLEQVMDTIKIEKSNGGYKNMKKQYNWLLVPIFKNLRGKYSHDDFFRPKGPNTGHQWLSNFDIENVMRQYELIYPGFKFLDVVPCDFDDIPQYQYSLKDYNNYTDKGIPKYKFGVIFNLDNSRQSGSHWTALYFDMKKKQIYYQDSVGNPPKSEFVKLMDSIEKQMKVDKKPIDRRVNKLRHQYQNSECGVYSISFILRLLNGESFDEIESKPIPDEDVNKCRIIYFNNNKD